MSTSNQKEIREFHIKNEPCHYDPEFPLLSIHLASNRPDQFTEFVEAMHASCTNKNAYEIIVKIDTEDTRMIECVDGLVKKFGETRVKPLIGLRKLGPWSTWEFYNDMFHMTHPKSCFLWNPSDEVRIVTQGWDEVLVKYIGFFPDNIFRLKLSDNRLRNFYHFTEVLGTPDNFPFMTKKWMDLCGLWGDCHSPDLFHQAISFYLGKDDIFRDIPIFDIELAGIEAGLLIPAAQSASRTFHIRRLWVIALSRVMRSRYLAHAAKIKFFIQSCAKGAKEVKIQEFIGYPSRVIATNDVGMHEDVVCLDKSFILYGVKLQILNLLAPIRCIIKNKLDRNLFLKTLLKKAKHRPLFLIFSLIAAALLLGNTGSWIVNLASVILLAVSVLAVNSTTIVVGDDAGKKKE